MESAAVAWPAIAVHVNFAMTSLKFGGIGKKKKSCITRKFIILHDGEGNPKQTAAPQRKLLNPHNTDSSDYISRGKRVWL